MKKEQFEKLLIWWDVGKTKRKDIAIIMGK
jgi:hypothetical protein